MSYTVNRSLGYQSWGVTNPWVFADLSQPQRQRGGPSPMVFQTRGPSLKTAHLGATEEELKRHRKRMETYAVVGMALSGASFLLAYSYYTGKLGRKRQVRPNRRRRRRTSRRRR